jgi:uncharacterized oxidoreductase
MPTIYPAPLKSAAQALLTAMGSAAAEAETVADHLIEANLKGHDSHGVGMLPHYVRNWQDGTLVLNQTLEITRDDGVFLVGDGRGGHGQVMARQMTERAITHAEAEGVAIAGLINAHHIGRVGTYGEWCAEAGLVSIHFVNVGGHAPCVAPTGGADARFGTNPLCISVPATPNCPATILDFATSEVAMGKVRVAMNEGRQMPDGYLVDQDGQPTTDPHIMFPESPDMPRGALATFGKHKGYGLSLMAELLGAALIGGVTIHPDQGWEQGIRNNMLMIVIDPDRLGGRGPFLAEAEAIIDWAKASPQADASTPIMVAGDPERQRKAERIEAGIVVDDVTWSELRDAADTVGLTAADFERLAG